jgi:hypothetical protein
MACIGSQLQFLPVVHQGFSCGHVHQCKCPATLIIGQSPDVVVVLDPALFICEKETKQEKSKPFYNPWKGIKILLP